MNKCVNKERKEGRKEGGKRKEGRKEGKKEGRLITDKSHSKSFDVSVTCISQSLKLIN